MDNALPYLPDIFFWNLRDTFQPAPLSKTSMKGHRRWGAAKKRSQKDTKEPLAYPASYPAKLYLEIPDSKDYKEE